MAYLTMEQVKQMGLKRGELIAVTAEEKIIREGEDRFPRDTYVGFYTDLFGGESPEDLGVGLFHNQKGNEVRSCDSRIKNGIIEIKRLKL